MTILTIVQASYDIITQLHKCTQHFIKKETTQMLKCKLDFSPIGPLSYNFIVITVVYFCILL